MLYFFQIAILLQFNFINRFQIYSSPNLSRKTLLFKLPLQKGFTTCKRRERNSLSMSWGSQQCWRCWLLLQRQSCQLCRLLGEKFSHGSRAANYAFVSNSLDDHGTLWWVYYEATMWALSCIMIIKFNYLLTKYKQCLPKITIIAFHTYNLF